MRPPHAAAPGPGRPARRAASREISRPLGHTTRRCGLREPTRKVVARDAVLPSGDPTDATCSRLNLSRRAHRRPLGPCAQQSVRDTGNVLGGQTGWEISQALGEFSTQPLVLLAASHYASSSVRYARCRPFTESAPAHTRQCRPLRHPSHPRVVACRPIGASRRQLVKQLDSMRGGPGTGRFSSAVDSRPLAGPERPGKYRDGWPSRKAMKHASSSHPGPTGPGERNRTRR